jgi:hypothetical protein
VAALRQRVVRWRVTRHLKRTTAALHRAEAELRTERDQFIGTLDMATEADGDYLTTGDARTRDEAFRSGREVSRAQGRIQDLEAKVLQLQARQDELLDELGRAVRSH